MFKYAHRFKFKLYALFATVYFLLSLSSMSVFAQTVYFGQISYLLPKGTRVEPINEDSNISYKIDRIVLDILKTQTGGQICKAFSADTKILKNFAFTNKNSAEQVLDICSNQIKSENKIIYRPFPKKYYLIIYPTGYVPPITGWTTPRNETFIFLSEQQYDLGFDKNRELFIKTISHELAISLDRKDTIGFAGIIEFGMMDIEKTDHNNDFIAIVRDAKIKHTLAAIRAFDFENKVASELKIKVSDQYLQFLNLNCVDKVKFLYPYINRISESTASEQLVNLIMDASGPSKYRSSEISLEEKITRLDEIKIYFLNNKNQNACEYMTQGVPFDAGVSFRGGPGPRVDGW